MEAEGHLPDMSNHRGTKQNGFLPLRTFVILLSAGTITATALINPIVGLVVALFLATVASLHNLIQ
jgi:hypothetical protein